jgi:peptidyl-tRNA hydrolase, PTH1 family
MRHLIVGLGNPGLKYSDTRHNIGFMIAQALAKEWGMVFKDLKRAFGTLAIGTVDEEEVFILMPRTYMNNSGQAVKKCIDYYKIPPENLLVVVDDVDIPFEELRMRPQGGPGGHNGLKSIQQHLKAQNYVRLRMGIGDREHGVLTNHVLGRFNKQEKVKLTEFISRGVNAIKLWLLEEDISRVMNKVNEKKLIKKQERENEDRDK